MTHIKSFTEAVNPEVRNEILLRQHLRYLESVEPESIEAMQSWVLEFKRPAQDIIQFLQELNWLQQNDYGELSVRDDVAKIFRDEVISSLSLMRHSGQDNGPHPLICNG